MKSLPPLPKRYYSIGEVGELLGENASTLRFWEKEFNQLRPRKNGRGDRLYTSKEIEMCNTIQHLLRVEGYTIEGAKQQILLSPRRSSALQDLNSRLIELLKNIQELKSEF